MFYFLIIVGFVIAALLGFISIGVTEKGSKALNDIWVKIRSWFAKEADPESAEYGCKHSIESFDAHGAIIPIDGYITWYLKTDKLSRTISREDTVAGIKEGLAFLTPHMSKVRFKEVLSESDAQIVVGFYRNGDSDLPQNFGTNTLAYAFLGNNTTAKNIVGDMYFNEAFSWASVHGNGSVSFPIVWTHEGCHSLGLGHASDPEDLLFPSYSANTRMNFSQDTINGLKFLYEGFDGPSTPPVVDPPVADDPEVVPVPPVSGGDLKGFLQKLLPSKTRINKLTETQLLVITEEVGIEAKKEDRKSATVTKVYNYLK